MKTIFFILCLSSVFSESIIASSSEYKISDHYNGKKFFQPGVPAAKGFFEVIKWKLSTKAAEWPNQISDNLEPRIAGILQENELSTTYINHATHLIQLKGLNILVDPIFSERASPVGFAGPKRIRAPGLNIDELPKLDIILITHNHYDHLDEKSIRRLSKKFNGVFVTPLGNAKLLKEFGAQYVIELDWWESHKIRLNADIEIDIHCVPAQHWSARGMFDRNDALWGGFVLQNKNFRVYVSGDTGYGSHFKEIQKRFGSFDLSILPIGAYEPRWFMKDQHMNPEDAVLAHLDIKSGMTIGSHFGTFQLTDEAHDQPEKDLKKAKADHAIDERSFVAPKNGETHLIKK